MDAQQVAATTTITHPAYESTVQSVIETMNNGRLGYETAAKHTEDPVITALLRRLGSERAKARDELIRVAADDFGYIPSDDDGTVPGAVHRGWIKLEGALAGDEAVVQSAIRGETEALDDFSDALDQGLPQPIAEVVRRTAAEVRDAIAELEAAIPSD